MASRRPDLKSALIASALLALLAFQPDDGADVQPTDGPVAIELVPVGLHTPARPDDAGRVGRLEFLAGYELRGDVPDFGGFSSLAVAADGRRAIMLSDVGSWLDIDFGLERDLPVRVERADMATLRDHERRLFEDLDRDSESLILLDDGALVGFEHHHRIEFYPAIDPWAFPSPAKRAPAQRHGVPDEVLVHPRNGGLEAMLRLADGRLLMFSEKAEMTAGTLRAWLVGPDDRSAQPLAYRPPEGGFHATDAALLPGGDVLLLLRRFTPLSGVAAALLRIARADIVPGAVLEGEEIARLAPPLTVDNMEGLAVRVDASGRTQIHMVSDNNFNPLQRSLYLVFALVEDAR